MKIGSRKIILVLAMLLTSCTSTQSVVCTVRGGEPYLNLSGYQYCGRKFSDGGKICRHSSECQGDCVLPDGWNPDEGREVVGRCRSNNTWYVDYGCLKIEDYQYRGAC